MTVSYLKQYIQECKQKGRHAALIELYFKYQTDKELYHEEGHHN